MTRRSGDPSRDYLRFLVLVGGLGIVLVLASTAAQGDDVAPELARGGDCVPALITLGARPVRVCLPAGEPRLGELLDARGESAPCELFDFDEAHRVRPWSWVRVRSGREGCWVRWETMPGRERLWLGGRIGLNSATAKDLDALPGVGPKTALAILGVRAELGTFRAVEDLSHARGVGPKTIEKLRPYVVLD